MNQRITQKTGEMIMLQHPDVVFYKFQIKVFSATEDLSVANKVSLFDEKGGTNGFALLRTYNIKCGIDCSGKAVLADENIPLALSFRVYPFQDLSVAQDKPARVLILGTPFKTRKEEKLLKTTIYLNLLIKFQTKQIGIKTLISIFYPFIKLEKVIIKVLLLYLKV